MKKKLNNPELLSIVSYFEGFPCRVLGKARIFPLKLLSRLFGHFLSDEEIPNQKLPRKLFLSPRNITSTI